MGKRIFSFSELVDAVETLRREGRRVVLCHGVFDLLHIGHIRYLRQARKLGDALVVTVTPDRFVDKGPGRPAFSEVLRAEAVSALDGVDAVAINEWPTAEETLRRLRPDVYAKGSEFRTLDDATGKIRKEAAIAAELGIRMEFIEDIVFSSSSLINRFFSSFSKDAQEYLEAFRQRHSIRDIFDRLDRFRDLSVLLVGDAILDEYIYCSPLGISSKDPVLAVHYQNAEVFAGGAIAVANHIAQHVKEVFLCTIIGSDEKKDFIERHLAPNVHLHAVTRIGSPTVRKTRIMDSYSFQKLVEVYHMDRAPLQSEYDKALEQLVHDLLPQADMVAVADFGNGCISQDMVKFLCAQPSFLAVNAQANAGNRGYHTIGRYPRADFVSLAVHEISLEYRNRSLPISDMMSDLRRRLGARRVLVTEGRRGCSVLTGDDFQRAPSFASNVIDRVGAGDALFSVAALAAYLDFPPDLTAFLGNISGSLAVENIGNAKAVSRSSMERFITAVMK